MNFKGLHKTSLVDYPGKISTVLFTGGCNLNCRYCYNPELVHNSSELVTYKTDDVLSFLTKRKGLIDGVVITGGEPTLLKGIGRFVESIKKIPLAVKIDTNGLRPDVITSLLEKSLIDYAAIDIKTSPEKYNSLTRKDVDFKQIKETIEAVKKSGIEYEVRTTCIPDYVTLEDFEKIKKEVGHVKRYYLQQFVNKITMDSLLEKKKPYTLSVLNEFQEYVNSFSGLCEIRGV